MLHVVKLSIVPQLSIVLLLLFFRYDPNTTAAHRSERRRRYSEGATRRATRHDVSSSDGIVDVSYCDPRRESIREGAYSIVNAESARDGAKSNASQLPTQIENKGHAPLTTDGSGEKTKLQNDPEMKMPQIEATKTSKLTHALK